MSVLLGNEKPEAEALKVMRERKGSWYAYQNHDMGHSELGHLQFLKCGKGCSCVKAPKRMPDTRVSLGWRYMLVGKVNLKDGTITEIKEKETANV